MRLNIGQRVRDAVLRGEILPAVAAALLGGKALLPERERE
jgi:hypothetical protein